MIVSTATVCKAASLSHPGCITRTRDATPRCTQRASRGPTSRAGSFIRVPAFLRQWSRALTLHGPLEGMRALTPITAWAS